MAFMNMCWILVLTSVVPHPDMAVVHTLIETWLIWQGTCHQGPGIPTRRWGASHRLAAGQGPEAVGFTETQKSYVQTCLHQLLTFGAPLQMCHVMVTNNAEDMLLIVVLPCSTVTEFFGTLLIVVQTSQISEFLQMRFGWLQHITRYAYLHDLSVMCSARSLCGI